MASPEKPVVDDAMVKRFADAISRAGNYVAFDGSALRVALQAALTSPAPEPEVIVTDMMESAGNTAYWRHEHLPNLKRMAEVYRAMERQRMKDAAGAPKAEPYRGVEALSLLGRSMRGHSRFGDDKLRYHHLRKGDT